MQYAYDEDSLTGLDTAKRGSGPKGRRVPGGRKWTGDLRQRGRTARGLPQAVFKISSYSHNSGAVWDRVNYIGRDGELEVEDPNGKTLGQVELERMVEDWNTEMGEEGGRRVAMSAMVAFPEGVDQEKATEAARQFFAAAFGENHDYIFAGHTDTKNFHVHVVVEAAGHDGKQLRIQRDDIQDLRMMFAEKAHEQGIELDASPRWARGLGAARQPGPEIEGIERRGGVPVLSPEASGGQGWSPERELAAASRLTADRRVQLEALVEVRVGRDPEAKDAPTPLEYARAGDGVSRYRPGDTRPGDGVSQAVTADPLAASNLPAGRDRCPAGRQPYVLAQDCPGTAAEAAPAYRERLEQHLAKAEARQERQRGADFELEP